MVGKPPDLLSANTFQASGPLARSPSRAERRHETVSGRDRPEREHRPGLRGLGPCRTRDALRPMEREAR